MATEVRRAAPTAENTEADQASTEGRADPHGVTWIRGLPPFDCQSFASTSAQSTIGTAGRGTAGRRASGFQLLAAGTVSITTGAGQVENFQGVPMPQGFALTVEFTSITTSGPVVVTW